MQLAEVLRLDKQPSLFSPELFLIQSQGMERMIAQTLADEFTSFCNFQFFLPLDFLSSIAQRLQMGIAPDGFSRQTLTFRLDQLLRDIDGEEFSQIQFYLSGERKELKRFQLSRRLANVFDQYQLMRPDMLKSWQQGLVTTQHISEPWQMGLWQRLMQQPGGDVHRGMLMSSVIEVLEGDKTLGLDLPKRISVIGLHTMPPLFLRYLNGLARHMDVHFFLLSPCRHYWGDVESKRQLYKKSIRNGDVMSPEDVKEHHPLLAVLGRQGKDLQAMMLEGAEFTLEFESYEDPLGVCDYAEARLLQKIQADLLEGRLVEPDAKGKSGDDSLRIVSCHSTLRELTVLKDHILHFLHSDSSLELRDIIVMAPDIQDYTPLIPGVFSSLQHSIADRSVRRRNAVFSGFLGFMGLFSGRFGWSEVLDVLRQPSIFPQFELSLADFPLLESWVVGSGVRWGLSAHQRQEAGTAAFEENSWRAGIERLLMGYSCGQDTIVDGVLPYTDLEGRGAAPLGGLCRFVDLLDEAQEEFTDRRSLGEWAQLLLHYITILFGEGGERELLELRSLVTDLGAAMDGFPEAELDFDVIREWFEQAAKEQRTSSGFLRGQLTFCSMLPMRSIPFKIVCLLGVNDGVFPKPERHDNFDLMGEAGESRLGDRSSRADDRYQFLEAILAAREKLYLSYVGQSALNNEKIPPSVVVTELIELLDEGYGVIDPTVHHPLHSFSSTYFSSGVVGPYFSYDKHSCEVANILRRGEVKKEPWWQGTIDSSDTVIDIDHLFRFFHNPQKYFVRQCLGLQLASLERLPEERETFLLQGLEKYHQEQLLIQQQLQTKTGIEEEGDFLLRAQANGSWPLGTSGKLALLTKKREVERFVETVVAQNLGDRLPSMHIDCSVAGFRIQGTLDNLSEGGVLITRYGAMRGRDLLLAWLHHQLLNTCGPDANSITCLVTADQVIHFDSGSDGPGLDAMLKIFQQGQGCPSQFFIEPAFVYAKQMRGKGHISPIDKAQTYLLNQLENGYEPEWQLLLENKVEEPLLDQEFEQLALDIMAPLVEAAYGA